MLSALFHLEARGFDDRYPAGQFVGYRALYLRGCGIEHRLELIYQGVVNGHLSLERWVDTCCTTPARLFGMFPQKGIIAPGSDADIVVWDPAGRTEIGVDKKHHMNMDYSVYEGMVLDGKVHTVMSRGTVIVENDTYLGREIGRAHV